MTIRILRETIRSLILEGRSYYRAKNGNGVIVLENIKSNQHISANNRLYIVFENSSWLDDPEVIALLEDPIYNAWKILQACEDEILGMLLLNKGVDGVAYGASEVKLSAAKPGYGPALYDMVMGAEINGIYPDRGDVSGPAYKMYTRYNLSRYDVEKKPLDDIEMKYTPDTIDDVSRSSDSIYLDRFDYDSPEKKNHKTWGFDRTNWVYNKKPLPEVDQMFRNGQLIYDKIANLIGRDMCNDFLDTLAHKYFEIRQFDDE